MHLPPDGHPACRQRLRVRLPTDPGAGWLVCQLRPGHRLFRRAANRRRQPVLPEHRGRRRPRCPGHHGRGLLRRLAQQHSAGPGQSRRAGAQERRQQDPGRVRRLSGLRADRHQQDWLCPVWCALHRHASARLCLHTRQRPPERPARRRPRRRRGPQPGMELCRPGRGTGSQRHRELPRPHRRGRAHRGRGHQPGARQFRPKPANPVQRGQLESAHQRWRVRRRRLRLRQGHAQLQARRRAKRQGRPGQCQHHRPRHSRRAPVPGNRHLRGHRLRGQVEPVRPQADHPRAAPGPHHAARRRPA